MKRNIILKTLTAAILGTAALQVQAQGIYVNKKNGESISYPKSILDKVTPEVFSDAQATKVNGVVMTSPVIRRAWSAVSSGSVPLVNRLT